MWTIEYIQKNVNQTNFNDKGIAENEAMLIKLINIGYEIPSIPNSL